MINVINGEMIVALMLQKDCRCKEDVADEQVRVCETRSLEAETRKKKQVPDREDWQQATQQNGAEDGEQLKHKRTDDDGNDGRCRTSCNSGWCWWSMETQANSMEKRALKRRSNERLSIQVKISCKRIKCHCNA